MTVQHQLKSWPEYYEAIADGSKSFDLRIDDRKYEVGDLVQFEEFRPATNNYTGMVTQRRITYILRDFAGLMPGYCIIAIEPPGE